MNREEKNEKVRQSLVDLFALTALSRDLLERHARMLDGKAKTPLDDLFHALRVAGVDLQAAVTEPSRAALYVDTESAVNLVLNIGLLRVAQQKLKAPQADKEREERDRAVQAHRDARALATDARARGFTIELFHSSLAKFDSPEIVKRMLFSPTAAGKVVTADGTPLDPITLPMRNLNSEGRHRVRLSVVEVSACDTYATVKLTWAANPGAVAIKGLFKRTVRLDYRLFRDVRNIGDLLLSLRLARREAEVIVSVTRALRPSDRDEDRLALKEICGLKALAAEVPTDLQRIQEALWHELR